MTVKTININSFDLSSIFWKKILDNSFLKIKPYQAQFFETIDSLESMFDARADESGEQSQGTLNFNTEEESPVLNFELEEDGSEVSSMNSPTPVENVQQEEFVNLTKQNIDDNDELVVHTLELEEESPQDVIEDLKDDIEKEEFTQINHGISAEQMALRSRQRMERLREITVKLRTPSGLTDLESEPAYKRREVELDDVVHSSESENSSYVLGEDDDKNIGLKPNNFLHDNVD